MLKEILTTICDYDTIIIHRHIRPDGDCIGSQIGLKEIIRTTFPDKQVYAVGEEKANLQFIGKMDKINDQAYQGALVIVLDVAVKARISDERYTLGEKVLLIDHHVKEDEIGDLEWIDTSYTSCSEMIMDFYEANKFVLKINDEARQALFCGIVTDTNRFSNPYISSRTFFLAGKLLEDGLDLRTLYANIYNEPLNIISLKGYILNNLKYTPNGLAYFYLDQALCDAYQIDYSHTSALANNLAFIEGVKIWFIAIIDKDGEKVRVSIRSEEYPVNQIAKKFGGGGHPYASGMILASPNEIPELVEAIDKFLVEVDK